MASLSLPPPRKTGPSAVTLMKDVPAEATGSTALVVTQQPQTGQQQQQLGHNKNSPRRTLRAPNYEVRCRAAAEVAKISRNKGNNTKPPKLFVPRALEDFDDGGAFPEIHVAQYPRHMGNPHLKRGSAASSSSSNGRQTTSRAIVNVEVDQNGEVSYDAIVKGGTNSGKKVYTKYEDLRGGEAKPEDVALPTDDDSREV